MVTKSKPNFLCSECGDTFAKWFGKCPSCSEWNTIKEFRESKSKVFSSKSNALAGQDLTQDEKIPGSGSLNPGSTGSKPQRITSSIGEVDRVLGDGIFPGSFTLFGGAPGVGKSTLALQIFLNVEGAMYFSGEESTDQVLHRAKRIMEPGLKEPKPGFSETNVMSTNSLEDIVTTVEKHNPPLVIVDSIQMVGMEESSLGQLSQLRENAEVLLKLAKSTGSAIIVIGHVTKSEEIAGPKVLEHIVDAVLQLEGERNSEIRILRSPKNRFGSTLEVGVFEMRSSGLTELANPSEFFLAERAENATGSAITVVREGSRNFLVEIQALTVKTNFGLPRRTSHGVDLSKLHLLLAVVSKFTPFKCETFDAYVNVVSGFRVKEPAADLAVVAAILSSRAEKEIPANTVIMGEVGLSGEIRSVANIEARLIEAEKLGFKKAIVPVRRDKKIPGSNPSEPGINKKLEIVEVKSIGELMKAVLGKSK